MAVPTEPRDRISRVRVRGFRSLADVTLELGNLTVLIGDNGSGKSALVEVFETLRYFTEPGANLRDYAHQHPSPVRNGSRAFEIEVLLTGSDPSPALTYGIEIEQKRGGLSVSKEWLEIAPHGIYGVLRPVEREGDRAAAFDPAGMYAATELEIAPTLLLLTHVVNRPRRRNADREEEHAIDRMGVVLGNLEVHVPFEVLPAWVARRYGRKSAMREAIMLQPVERLETMASNIANVWTRLHELGEEHWRETMDLVRIGLGDDVDTVTPTPDAAGGQHAIAVRYKSSGLVHAAALSDGTLAYLAFVALLRLPSKRSLLAFDEPELHLHPGLLVRVLAMFEQIAEECPVVIATHSDRLLDALATPAASAIVCELDAHRQTRLRRLSSELLSEWMRDFRGLGDLRASGLEQAVLQPPDAEK
jgi:energy-coupling factor transporter ATP-binding protein EcfA2